MALPAEVGPFLFRSYIVNTLGRPFTAFESGECTSAVRQRPASGTLAAGLKAEGSLSLLT